MFKEYKNIINKKEKDFLKSTIIDSNTFPFYLRTTEIVNAPNNYFPFLSHVVLHKPEDQKTNRINSSLYNYCTELFQRISKRYKFKYKEIYRIALNLTFKNGKKESLIHRDHPYPHKQLLIYLHTDDLKSCTCIFNKDKIKKIIPTPNKGVMWDNLKHYHITPKKGYRLVLVYTFL